jgi:hypothetical protein
LHRGVNPADNGEQSTEVMNVQRGKPATVPRPQEDTSTPGFITNDAAKHQLKNAADIATAQRQQQVHEKAKIAQQLSTDPATVPLPAPPKPRLETRH